MTARPMPANRRVAPRAKAATAAPSEAPGELLDERKRAPSGKAPRRGKAPPAAAKAPPPVAPRRSRSLPWAQLLTAGRLFLGTLLFFGLMAGSSFGLYRYISTSARFAVKNIVVDGAAHRSAADVARLAGVEAGKNVFAIDLEVARRAILADAYIEQATVDRKLPGTIRITVVEREPTALVALGGSLYLSARGGDVFKRFEPGDPADLVVITGVGGEGEMIRDREGLVALVKKAQDVIADYERLGPARHFPLQEVHVTDEGGTDLVVGREAVTLALGKSPYRPKIERGARVLAEIDRRRGTPSVVFLDNDAHPERVVARMR